MYTTNFNGNLPIPSDNFMTYLMKKTSNITCLSLSNISENICEEDCFPVFGSNFTQSKQIVSRFLRYLSKIPECYVSNCIVYDEGTINIIQDLFTNPDAKSVPFLSNSLEVYCRPNLLEDTPTIGILSFEVINSTDMLKDLENTQSLS
jgi:hypothetical protein